MGHPSIKAPLRAILSRLALRLLAILCAALAVGTLLNRVSASFERDARPAGFTRGVLQGALMPMALPNLLVGRDVTIYSVNNTGVKYKLGYTIGVNVCGAVFFGFFYWRVSRLRKWPIHNPAGLSPSSPVS